MVWPLVLTGSVNRQGFLAASSRWRPPGPLRVVQLSSACNSFGYSRQSGRHPLDARLVRCDRRIVRYVVSPKIDYRENELDWLVRLKSRRHFSRLIRTDLKLYCVST